MDHDDPAEALTELREKRVGLLELLQAAAGSGLAAYAVWALLLQPGFRRVPLRLQVLAAHQCGLRPAVGYELNPWLVGLARLHAWRAGCSGSVCYHRKDLWKVSLRDCHNVSVFLAPSVLPLLEDKLQVELPAGARVVSGRFPLPTWQPVAVVGKGMDRVWAYDVHGTRPAVSSCGVPVKAIPESSSTSISKGPV
ncbi:adenine nucleotide translocase lysine N-methyltransferase isoform X3 [Meriones unguiculatus]|uniref:adenine nucleotide translocase lysine N-methyltransferase isoform X3 n=1 Tax=Meriones unguiculatus TaxID=10047 RepID=UPI00293EF733|nr:adenine nucleotide translocase lysine N-methyltransferase isoform X3 [Meriones unguiculatus]